MSLAKQVFAAFVAGVTVCCAVYALAAPAMGTRIAIDNFTFGPDAVTVPVGTRIVWENHDDIPHSIVETQGKFHSPALDTEDSYGLTFDTAGTFEYFCGLHPHMKGKVVVAP